MGKHLYMAMDDKLLHVVYVKVKKDEFNWNWMNWNELLATEKTPTFDC